MYQLVYMPDNEVVKGFFEFVHLSAALAWPVVPKHGAASVSHYMFQPVTFVLHENA